MQNTRLTLTAGVAISLAGLAGCGAGARYPHYYVLRIPPSITAAGPNAQSNLGSVAVREFSAPRFLTSGGITYRQSSEQVDFYQYHRWAEDPRRMVTNAVLREIQARGLFQSADLFDGHGSPEWLLTGSIDHLEEVDAGTTVSIQVEVSASLLNVRTREVVWQNTLSKTVDLGQRSVPGVVAGMSEGVTETLNDLVSSMQQRLGTVAFQRPESSGR